MSTPDARINILFVDDESLILDGLRRQFRAQRNEWDMRFADSGESALDMLKAQPADVVISDMRMPGMDGAALLSMVRNRWPETVRFILSGQTDQGQLLTAVGAIHQFLQKPCDAKVICRAITRANELATAIEPIALRKLVSGIESLPVLSSTYSRLTQTINDEDSDIEDVTKIVRTDVGLSTKLLQMVNSAFFGLPRGVTDVKDAIMLIGIRRLQAITLTSQVFDSLAIDDAGSPLIERVWKHSIETGAAACAKARHAGCPANVCETARLAGMLSLIGRALLLRFLPSRVQKAQENAVKRSISLTEAETREFGVPQQAIGAYALGLWAFDDDIIECVAHQATPEQSSMHTPSDPLRFVHAARTRNTDDDLIDALPAAGEWLERLADDTQEAA